MRFLWNHLQILALVLPVTVAVATSTLTTSASSMSPSKVVTPTTASCITNLIQDPSFNDGVSHFTLNVGNSMSVINGFYSHGYFMQVESSDNYLEIFQSIDGIVAREPYTLSFDFMFYDSHLDHCDISIYSNGWDYTSDYILDQTYSDLSPNIWNTFESVIFFDSSNDGQILGIDVYCSGHQEKRDDNAPEYLVDFDNFNLNDGQCVKSSSPVTPSPSSTPISTPLVRPTSSAHVSTPIKSCRKSSKSSTILASSTPLVTPTVRPSSRRPISSRSVSFSASVIPVSSSAAIASISHPSSAKVPSIRPSVVSRRPISSSLSIATPSSVLQSSVLSETSYPSPSGTGLNSFPSATLSQGTISPTSTESASTRLSPSASLQSGGFPSVPGLGSASSLSPTGSGSESDSGEYTTSTVFTTLVSTITACPPSVTDCPDSAKTTHITTETIIDYTTICPVTATETAAAGSGTVQTISGASDVIKISTTGVAGPKPTDTTVKEENTINELPGKEKSSKPTVTAIAPDSIPSASQADEVVKPAYLSSLESSASITGAATKLVYDVESAASSSLEGSASVTATTAQSFYRTPEQNSPTLAIASLTSFTKTPTTSAEGSLWTGAASSLRFSSLTAALSAVLVALILL